MLRARNVLRVIAGALLLTLAWPGGARADTSAESAVSSETDTSSQNTKGNWILEGREWRFYNENGTLLKNQWVFWNGCWYYMDSDGFMVTGKRRISGKYYFFRDDGGMATGWLYDYDRSRWYYLCENGSYYTGWLKTGDGWYYFTSSGRMVQGIRQPVGSALYCFFDSGRLIADAFDGLSFYNADGIRDSSHDIVRKGKRALKTSEKQQITRAFARIPAYWVQRFIDEGWELWYYSDQKYFSAPDTDQGIYYVRWRTDTTYKKMKITDPSAIPMAFGEFIASEQAKDEAAGKSTTAVSLSDVMTSFDQYVSSGGTVTSLPSYFNSDTGVVFANMFANYCRPEVRADIRTEESELAKQFDTFLHTWSDNAKPELEEMNGDGTYTRRGSSDSAPSGPAADPELKKK